MKLKTTHYGHLFSRLLLFIVLIPIASMIGLSTLNKDRRCGTGDGLAIFFYIFIFYCLWVIGLLIEAYFLHINKKTEKRNLNIILALLFPLLLLLLSLYFLIVNFFH